MAHRRLTAREQKLLDGFGKDYGRYEWRVRERVGKFSDAQLVELIAACDAHSQTNCWFCAFHAAPMAKRAALHEQACRAASVEAKRLAAERGW